MMKQSRKERGTNRKNVIRWESGMETAKPIWCDVGRKGSNIPVWKDKNTTLREDLWKEGRKEEKKKKKKYEKVWYSLKRKRFISVP